MIVFSNHNFFSSYFEKLEKEKGNYFDALIPIEKRKIEKVSKTTNEENPYPRIFTSIKAFEKFKNLLDEFGNTKENLANYSFVFHRMKRDELIYDDFQKLQFTYFLLKFDINIDRIKSMKEIGKIEYREGIYNRI
jgi:hypothetical protein